MAFFNWFKKNKKGKIDENLNDNNPKKIDEQISNISDDNQTDEENNIQDIEKHSNNLDNIENNEEFSQNLDNIQNIEDNSNSLDNINDIEETSYISDNSENIQKHSDISDNNVKNIEHNSNNLDNIQNIKENNEIENIFSNINTNQNTEEYQEVKELTEEIENIEDSQEIENIKTEIQHEIKKKQDISNNLNDIEQEEEIGEELKKQGFFSKIKMGLAKTRDSILNSIDQVLGSFTKIDEELFEELEESLIMSDIGVETSVSIIEKVKEIVKKERIKDVDIIKNVIVRVISDILEEETEELNLKSPSVILIIGVNGVGKTTTIGKLTNNYKKDGKKVILAAGDTFRAAAIDQLQVWGDRNKIDVIKHQEGSDPAAVVFDAIQAGKARGADLLICDTAGRLHNKKNLMEELKKIARVINKENPDAQIETFLVLDATTGQNALQQAKLFSEATDITGIVLTKLDGTAKGGVIIAIKNELKIPVRFIGVGEGIDDLRPFDAKEFSKALFE